jgi:hypothetical protein
MDLQEKNRELQDEVNRLEDKNKKLEFLVAIQRAEISCLRNLNNSLHDVEKKFLSSSKRRIKSTEIDNRNKPQ